MKTSSRQDHEPAEWTESFMLDDGRVILTDRCILIDQKYVQAVPLPPDGKPTNYIKVRRYFGLKARNRFSLAEMKVRALGSYEGPDYLVLQKEYIAFLLERIPKEQLYFGMTGTERDPVWFYRGDLPLGILAPFDQDPVYDQRLIDDAKAGSAYAQFMLGRYYSEPDGSPPIDFTESKKWLEKAVEQNHAKAHLKLGFLYLFGLGGERDLNKSFDLFERAIALGCNEAIRCRNSSLDTSFTEEFLKLFDRAVSGRD